MRKTNSVVSASDTNYLLLDIRLINSARSGMAPAAPERVVLSAPAAAPHSRASSISRPSEIATASPPLNASPEPTVSIASTSNAGT